MGDKYIKDGKYFEKGDGLFGSDKELGVVKDGGLFFNDEIIMHDLFTPNKTIETDWTGTVKDVVEKDHLSEFIQGHREGTRIEPDSNPFSSDGQRSHEWTQELGGPKVRKPTSSEEVESLRGNEEASETGSSLSCSGGGYGSIEPTQDSLSIHAKAGHRITHKTDHRPMAVKRDHRKIHKD
jgi:hypothetical protein